MANHSERPSRAGPFSGSSRLACGPLRSKPRAGPPELVARRGGAWPRGRGVFCSVPQRLLLAASAPTGPSSGRCLGHGLLCCGASAAAGASSAKCLGRGGGDKKPRSLMFLVLILAPELAYAGKG